MTTIMVNRNEATPISPELWGVFFEDINHAADGGLYAELVQNRSFAYSEADSPGWHALTAWRTEGDVRRCSDEPLSPNAPVFLRMGEHGVAARACNEGFDGIVVRRGQTYRCSMFVRAEGSTRVDVVLAAGGVAVSAVIPVTGSRTWARVEAVLQATVDAADGTLTVATDGDSLVDIDLVSLFPEHVFAGDDNGLRQDLAQAVAALRPRFMRFPGGCVAHGLGLDNMYRWPETVGPVQDRRHDANLWGYHQSRGLGYYEMFRFCAQIGASPLPVVAAGVCCQNTIGGPVPLPDTEMDAYIQEVLDLVEFANSTTDTRWGAVRASLGHPAPFGLRFLGVGNEDQIDEVFRDRFARLLRALRERHPEIQVVGTAGPAPHGPDFEAGWALARELEVPVVDEHSYKSPRWFFQNVHRYDDYDRTGPRVYLGEYGSWGNTMLNALSEAAYMTGLERNGDVVALASYAPLLAKVDHTQWVPDLIYFDGERVYETLNYHVQGMFSRTAGDRALHLEIADAPSWFRAAGGATRFAVSAKGFEVRCSDITVQDRPLPDVTLGSDSGRFDLTTDLGSLDVELALTLHVEAGDAERGSFAVHVGDLDGGEHWEWNFGTWLNRTMTLHTTTDGFRDEASPGVPFRLEVGREYRLRLGVGGDGRVFSVFVDGVLLHRHVDEDAPEHRFVASCVTDSRTGRTALRIVNATDEETPVELVDAEGRPLVVLAAETLACAPADGVPFASAPTRPTGLCVQGGVRVPPWSLTVLQLA
ncbi:alpha-L-arabinofuranosidase C-terminal domain-containing protein [Plantibacter sp. ME-Dv--P-122b]|uniref:alpha-L-arabinofuranosidase C-terminal domain-containing protein n=1 Tax=Plantibacter sp. ME-Dv--P-122b TaxID=3040300 RepID=UPI0025510435|nr:alpha-L-arabinofuranosidase C-terminal domain-containing protein [Plantibacter sp. ME-Dv--P-122b]